MISAFESLFSKADKEAQDFVNNLRSRIKSIEATMGDDWESAEYIKATNQLKFLQNCIRIVVTQQNMSVNLTDTIAKDIIQQIDYQSEIARLRLSNIFLLKMCTKLKGHKIIKRPRYILHPKYINKV